jgi:pimeloyl-ACP methyl ester carboxylesterase
MNLYRTVVAGLILGTSLASQALADSENSRHGERERAHQIVTIDHFVPHISTVPANRGELVHLFVRERTEGFGRCACSLSGQGRAPGEREDDADQRANRAVVLMIHGRSVPILAGMDLSSDDYNWALSLARAGIDVFMLDFQGSGRSPRPKMDDPCNVPKTQQSAVLIPNPLRASCTASYPFTLNTAGSDWDELDAVIDYIRDLRGVDKVHLVAWSQGSSRIGPYAAKPQYRDKVASLLFLAPIFNAGLEPAFPVPPKDPPAKIPAAGTPMTLLTRADHFAGWDAEINEIKCPGGQREPGIQNLVWASIMDSDELGRRWGPPPAGAPAGSPPEGVMRVRQVQLWGWTLEVAQALNVPTLIIQGEFDTGLGGRQHLAALYSAVQHPNKLRFKVECAGHFLPWEMQRGILHRVSQEWIKHGRVAGEEQGEFFVTKEGDLGPLP